MVVGGGIVLGPSRAAPLIAARALPRLREATTHPELAAGTARKNRRRIQRAVRRRIAHVARHVDERVVERPQRVELLEEPRKLAVKVLVECREELLRRGDAGLGVVVVADGRRVVGVRDRPMVVRGKVQRVACIAKVPEITRGKTGIRMPSPAR